MCIRDRNPAVYYYNFEKTDTLNLYADVMNYMKYDAATIGNHDIETGHDVYDKFNKELNFPWLAANAINTETNQPYFKPVSYTHLTLPTSDLVKISVVPVSLKKKTRERQREQESNTERLSTLYNKRLERKTTH